MNKTGKKLDNNMIHQKGSQLQKLLIEPQVLPHAKTWKKNDQKRLKKLLHKVKRYSHVTTIV